jgi:hypothetical protein
VDAWYTVEADDMICGSCRAMADAVQRLKTGFEHFKADVYE